MNRFDGQTVIITGGTRGIGKGIAEAFLKDGATVIVTYAGNAAAAEKFVEENSEYKEKIDCYKFNVAEYSECEDFYRKLDGKYESIEILINNAGIRKDSIVGMMSSEDWKAVMDINLTGNFNMGKLAVQRMMGNRYGRIINITSPSGKMGIEGQANYAATKAGQIGFTRTLAKEVAKRKITVNCVSPGFIDTELLSDLSDDMKKAYKQSVPMKRFGKVEEVASAVLYLSSKEAAYITGSTLEVTGGL